MGLVRDSVFVQDNAPVSSNPSSSWLTPTQMGLVVLFGAIAALVMVMRLVL
jgi:hypothetical protein